MRAYLLAALILAAPATVHAANITTTTDGYTYFNRPGADVATHDADIDACRKQAGLLHQPMQQTTVVVTGGVYGAIGAAIGTAIAQAILDAHAHPINVENCMVVRGWRVVALDKDEGAAVAALERKDKIAKLEPWIGADAPHGTIVRSFDNDLASASAASVFIAGHVTTSGMLSADIAKKPHAPPAAAVADPPDPETMAKTAKPPKALKASALGGVPAGDGLVVITIKGAGAVALGFERIGPNPTTPAWVDGHPASFTASQSQADFASAGSGSGLTLAFVVPPGRWRMVYAANGFAGVSFCMGSPAFDVAAGDVIYAGAFDPDALGHPNLDVAPVKAVFSSLSGLADKVQPAAYINGTTGLCGGVYAYALEMPDRPFVEGYAWGSRANVAVATAPVAAPAAAPAVPIVPPPPAPPAPAAAVKS